MGVEGCRRLATTFEGLDSILIMLSLAPERIKVQKLIILCLTCWMVKSVGLKLDHRDVFQDCLHPWECWEGLARALEALLYWYLGTDLLPKIRQFWLTRTKFIILGLDCANRIINWH